MKRTVNKEWHVAHPMPRNATPEQRLDWHLMHAANCSCRGMPASIRKELEARALIAPTLHGFR